MHISDLKSFTSVRNQRAKKKSKSHLADQLAPSINPCNLVCTQLRTPIKDLGPLLNVKMEFLITNIRWLRNHLIFIMGIPILVKRYLYTEMVPLDAGLRPLCNNLDDPKPEIKIYKNGCLHTQTWLQGHIMDKTIKKHSKATKSWSNGHYDSILSCTDTLWN